MEITAMMKYVVKQVSQVFLLFFSVVVIVVVVIVVFFFFFFFLLCLTTTSTCKEKSYLSDWLVADKEK